MGYVPSSRSYNLRATGPSTMTSTHALLLASLTVAPVVTALCPAQEQPAPDAPNASSAQQAERSYPQLRYPRDKERVIAVVGDRPIQLVDLVLHIEDRHHPGFEEFLAGPDGKGTPAGARMLESNLIAPWVRQFADICALKAEAEAMEGYDPEQAEAALSAALKESFEAHLAAYVDDLQRRGLPTDISQDRIDRILADYQLRYGLQTEMQGWLDYLQPLQPWTKGELRDFFTDNARVFGGGVTLAHILIQHRDPGTGILMQDKQQARAASRLAEVQRRLAAGEDFAELARLFSDDTKTAPQGGVFKGVQRFDYRLPPQICRTAWLLKDGQVSDVVETAFGWHLIQRIEHVQKKFMLFTDAAVPSIRVTRQRMLQEDLLFKLRDKYGVELKL